MWRRHPCASLCRASLRYGGAQELLKWCVRWERITESIGKSAEEWHFTLRESQPSVNNEVFRTFP